MFVMLPFENHVIIIICVCVCVVYLMIILGMTNTLLHLEEC